jgi:hypothetical protein
MRKNDLHYKSNQVGSSQIWNGRNWLARDWNRKTVITTLVSDLASAYYWR